MKKAAFAVLAVVLVLSVSVIGYRVYRDRQREAQWRAVEVEMVQLEFAAYVERLQYYAGGQGRDRLKKIADEFPRKDTGLVVQLPFVEAVEGESVVFFPRIIAVYLGSGAHRAGILPGDDIRSISGVSIKIRCAKDDVACPTDEEIKKVLAAIDERQQSTFGLRRDGQVVIVGVTSVPYGQDIRDYLASHLDGYLKQLDAVAPKVAALAAKVSTLDEKNIESLSAEARAVAKEVHAPFDDLEAYMETRVILPPEPTRADPQF